MPDRGRVRASRRRAVTADPRLHSAGPAVRIVQFILRSDEPQRREKGHANLDAYLETKTVWVQL